MTDFFGLDLWAEAAPVRPPEPVVHTVGALTRLIRRLLEKELGEVWVAGEISNLKMPGSGHLYFSLKDAEAVINVVMFRAEAQRLDFRPVDGQAVRLFGRLTVYDSRGQYQIVAVTLQTQGKGTLQERFEALKRKLHLEGLFDPERKRSLPLFPERVGIVTSLQGAVLQDFTRILARRAPGLIIQVHGCRVQGPGSAEEIAAGIARFNGRGEVEVIVVARGGGSIEDLWAFNEEVVARALAASGIPTISAVGHETDFTIADFVADLRAPTPSAAAELITRDWGEWREELEQKSQRLRRAARGVLQLETDRWRRLAESYVFREPRRMIQHWQQKVDDREAGLRRGLKDACLARRHQLDKLVLRWRQVDPRVRLQTWLDRLEQWEARLKNVGPQATLQRGYALMTDQTGRVIRDVAQIGIGTSAKIRLAQGCLEVKVEKKTS